MNEEKASTDLSADQQKKAYSKPTVKEIRLVAEEAVLALCKHNNGIGNFGLCIPDRCCVMHPRS